jgi:transposase-like protein
VLSVVNDDGATANGSSLIDEIVREGARRMLAAALEAEVNAHLAGLAGECDEHGRRFVVRNGYHRPRKVTTAAGVVEVKAPRVNDKRVDEQTSERKRFSSAILPPWCRKSPKISEVLPLLYLHGLSSGDFVPALEQFLGSATGLSPATVTRLTQQWQADHAAFMDRAISEADYVDVWADGLHLNVRLEEAKACVLVLVGVRGRQKGTRRTRGRLPRIGRVLGRPAARRFPPGHARPVLAIGDGALGFWKALAEVFPATREQRCWGHETANVLDSMPKSAQPGAKKAIQGIYNAEDRDCRGGDQDTRPALRREVPQGCQEDHRRQGADVGVLPASPLSNELTFGPPIPSSLPFPPSACARRSPAGPAPARPRWPWSSDSSSPPSSGGAP